MFWFGSPFFQATGLTGLHVAKNPHHTLTALYNKILRAVAKMPQDAAYRRYTEQIVSERAKVVATVNKPELTLDDLDIKQNSLVDTLGSWSGG